MMRAIQGFFVAISTTVLFVVGSAVDAQSNADVERMFLDDLEVTVEQVTNPGFETILSSPVFRVAYVLMASQGEMSPGGEYHVWIKDDRLVPILGLGSLHTDDPLDFMDGLVDPAFRLDEGTAAQFMSVLKELMGRDSFESVPVESVQNNGDRWYFLTGDFFDSYTGFVVSVDAGGAVTDLAYELSMLPKEE